MLKKLLANTFFLFLIPCIFNACKKVDINFGSQFIDNSLSDIVKVDTFSADISTVYIDSFSTTSTGTTLFGGYKDPYFGRIDTKTFFEVAPPTTTASDFTRSIYDSLYITLKLNKNYYGDTTNPVHIDISRLAEPIIPPSVYGDPGSTLYNKNKFSVYPTPLGSTDIVVRPNLTDTIHIKLDDNLGKEFFTKIKSASLDFQNTTNFLNYFYGLRIGSTSNSSAIFGCTDSASIILAYHNPSLNKDSSRLEFPVTNRNLHFINITADRTGTPLQNLGSINQPGKKNVISSTVTNNASYVQSTSGAMVKIRFPNIQDVQKLPNYTKFLKAQLIIRPVINTYNPVYNLPPRLRLSTTTVMNQLGIDLTQVTSNGTGSVQYGNLVVDYFNGQTSYSYDVTNYVKSILTDPSYPYYQAGILLTPPYPAFNTQFGRAIIGDKNNPNLNSRIELDIYYVAVKPN